MKKLNNFLTKKYGKGKSVEELAELFASGGNCTDCPIKGKCQKDLKNNSSIDCKEELLKFM